METKFNIEAMFFPGLYESILCDSDSQYYAEKEYADYLMGEYPGFEVDPDTDIQADYERFRNDMAKAWADSWKDYLPNIVISCQYTDLVPPRNTGYGPDYRFGTDKVYVDIELVPDWFAHMKKFIYDNHEWFEDRIKKDWTSYDGFMSFMENDIDGWIQGLMDEDERYVGTTVAYMMMFEHDNFWEGVNFDALGAVCYDSYLSLTEEKQAELNECAEKLAEERRIKEYDEKHQLKLDFPES